MVDGLRRLALDCCKLFISSSSCRGGILLQNAVRRDGIAQCLRQLSTSEQSSLASETKENFFRTSQDNPCHHAVHHIGQYYTMPISDVKDILPVGSSPKWQKQIGTFQEASIMIRRPALEIIDHLKGTNFDHPPVRHVLYGSKGSGKTMTLSHVLHYCHLQGWLMVHVPCANSWNAKGRFDYTDSTHTDGMYDQPAFSAEWLKHFKARNERFMKQLLTSEQYTWSKREATESGQPLLAVIEQGLSRPKNATDAIGVILKELQLQSFSGQYKMLFAVKAVNGFFAEMTAVRKPGGYIIRVSEMTMMQNFKKMLLGNWINGAIVTSVDQHLAQGRKSDYKPFYLLHKQGFETMDPFVPTFVDNYSDKELESCLAMYKEKRWLQNEEAYTDDGKAQLRFLSEKNPGALQRICAPL